MSNFSCRVRTTVILLAAVSVSVTSLSEVHGQDSPPTTWSGTLESNSGPLRIVFRLTETNGRLTGVGLSPDQSTKEMRLDEIEIDSKSFSLKIPDAKASFSGTFSDDRMTINGTFKQGRGSLPLTLSKNATDAESPPVELSQTERLKRFEDIVANYVKRDLAVGAEILVIEKGVTILHQSFGLASKDQARKWQNDQLCNIRSMTKPITSTAAQILIDQKKLELDAPVAKYLESFDNEDAKMITVRQVLTHRSGLPLTNLLSPNQFPSLKDQVDAIGESGPQFEPGSKFWYSDIGTDVVGRLVEKISGEPLDKFVTREIFEPLGMTNTLYGIKGQDERLKNAAHAYMKGAKGWKAFWKGEKALYPFAWGSQTVYSTTTDYAKFLRLFLDQGKVGDRQLISKDAVERMLQPISKMTGMGSDRPYPTGFYNLEPFYGQMMMTHRRSGQKKGRPIVIGHGGSDGTNAWAWPERDLIVLYFTQSRGGPTPIRIERPIERFIVNSVHQPNESNAPEALRPYLGSFMANYSSFKNEEFTVTHRDGKLILDVPSQMTFELLPPDEKEYWAFAIAPEKIKVSFDQDQNGNVIGLRLHKGSNVFEVPRKGTARATELLKKRLATEADRGQ